MGWPSIGQFLVEVHIRHRMVFWVGPPGGVFYRCYFLRVEKKRKDILYVFCLVGWGGNGRGLMFLKELADIFVRTVDLILRLAKFECMNWLFFWLLHLLGKTWAALQTQESLVLYYNRPSEGSKTTFFGG